MQNDRPKSKQINKYSKPTMLINTLNANDINLANNRGGQIYRKAGLNYMLSIRNLL